MRLRDLLTSKASLLACRSKAAGYAKNKLDSRNRAVQADILLTKIGKFYKEMMVFSDKQI